MRRPQRRPYPDNLYTRRLTLLEGRIVSVKEGNLTTGSFDLEYIGPDLDAWDQILTIKANSYPKLRVQFGGSLDTTAGWYEAYLYGVGPKLVGRIYDNPKENLFRVFNKIALTEPDITLFDIYRDDQHTKALSIRNDLIMELTELGSGVLHQIPLTTLPRVVKIKKSYSDFATASTTNDIEIFSLPPGGIILDVFANVEEAFGGGAISDYTISVGTSADNDEYLLANSVTSAGLIVDSSQKGTRLTTAGMTNLHDLANPTSIRAYATSTGNNLDQATTGKITFYILYYVIP